MTTSKKKKKWLLLKIMNMNCYRLTMKGTNFIIISKVIPPVSSLCYHSRIFLPNTDANLPSVVD